MMPSVKIAALILMTIGFFPAGWLGPFTAVAQNQTEALPQVRLSASKIANGKVLLLQLNTDSVNSPASDMQIYFNKTAYRVHPHPLKGKGNYYALIGIPYRINAGAAELTLKYADVNGYQTRSIPFQIVRGQYRTDILKVDSRRVDPNKKDRQRANREYHEVKQIYASSSAEKIWQGPFQLPLQSKITSPFGNRRVFNGKLKSYHNGLDFRAAIGTPVHAANTGIVKAAKDLFYSGNAVILDHGREIFTIYAHVSKIEVNVDQRIQKGQLIGLTGATGRVSGPHLHWGVKVNGIAVDPLQFTEIMADLMLQQ